MSDFAELTQRLSCGRPGCACQHCSGPKLKTHCPAHADENPSLSLTEGADGKVLWHCKAGCSQQAVLEALKERGLWHDGSRDPGTPIPATPSKPANQQRRITATYDYCDEHGTLLYQAVRYAPKAFSLRKPAGTPGQWIHSLEDTRRVLYRLPEVLAAVERGKPVCLTEGEKDVDALRELGLCATCNPMGAGKWDAAYTETLTGARVVILPDNDDVGFAHADHVAAALFGQAKSVRVVRLPGLPDKGDVSDWLDAGGTFPSLKALVKGAADWTPESVRLTGAEPRPATTGAPKRNSIAERAIDLADVGSPGELPLLFGQYLMKGSSHWLTGQTGIGKSTFVYNLACALAEGTPLWGIDCEQTRVLYLDLESGDVGRAMKLERLYWDAPRIRGHLFFLREALHFTEELPDLLGFVRENNVGLVIFDTARRCFSVKDENDNAEVYNRIVPVLDALKLAGVATLTLGHPAKNGNGSARGAGAQEDAGDVNLSLSIHSRKMSDKNGVIALNVTKNRLLGLGLPTLYLQRVGNDRFDSVDGGTSSEQEEQEATVGGSCETATIDLLTKLGRPMRFSEIIPKLMELGFSLSTAKRVLKSLCAAGEIEKGEDGLYALTDPFAGEG